jgi:hypothetical protein
VLLLAVSVLLLLVSVLLLFVEWIVPVRAEIFFGS